LKLDLEILSAINYKDHLVLIAGSRTPAIRRSMDEPKPVDFNNCMDRVA
jgi:hypothetical protein